MRENEIKSDLRSMAYFLNSWDKNVKNANLLSNLKISSRKDISYSIEKSEPLIFLNIDIDRHTIPSGIDKLGKDDRNFDVHLNITFNELDSEEFEFNDPILNLGVAIKIKGDYTKGNDIKKAMCSWHLDKEPNTAAQQSFCHPIYHLNFGGEHMIDEAVTKNDFFGNLLLLPNPRIIHPPMDVILSCDFIIRNFYERKKHKKITDLPGYKNLINKAAKRYWTSFANAFASNWNVDLKVKNLSYDHIVGNN